MTKEEITKKLIDILTQKLEVNMQVTESTALIADSVLDSLEFMNYITYVEEVFEMSISDEQIEKLQLGILNNMIDFIYNNK